MRCGPMLQPMAISAAKLLRRRRRGKTRTDSLDDKSPYNLGRRQ